MYIYIYIYIYIYTIVLYNSLNDLFLCSRYQNIRKLNSTYITEYGYKGPVSQPVSQSVCLSLKDRLTSASQSVCLSLKDRLTFINDLYRFRRYKNIRKMVSTYFTECGCKGPASQPVSQPVSRYVCT